jgi:hypothetical protein
MANGALKDLSFVLARKIGGQNVFGGTFYYSKKKSFHLIANVYSL